ncbi:MAG TPA: phage shock protein operon transcriptional activator [Sphingomicrobium sp.]|nr:phage shock protein operon transcriptional activator [Sphingomicrobium sp.]
MERTNQFVGQSLAFLDAVERASRAAPLNRPVLVIGERGTGKELIAERLHHLSSRWSGPLVTMNCAALPENLIEAELFGHEAGSFTGAAKTRHGRFEEADGGTLFLDELATLSSPAQDRLLRAVEYGEVTRIGASRPISVDVRIVAATNEHLPRLVDQGRFRADLLDRLSFEVVTLPPLRARQGDIPLLAEHFGRRMGVELEWTNWPGFGADAMRALSTYPWPGNVRELRNVVERAVYRHEDPERPIEQIQFDPFASPWAAALGSGGEPHLPPVGMTAEPMSDGPPAAVPPPAQPSEEVDDFRGAVTAYERRILEDALARNRYNQKATATALGLSYDQLRHALKRHELLNAAPS